MRHAFTALPGSRGLLSPCNRLLKRRPPRGLFPSQQFPSCSNIKLPNYSTGINKSSNALPRTSGGLTRFYRGGRCIQLRCWRRHHRQTVRMSSNGVQVAVAPRHHRQCDFRGQSKGHDHKLRPRTCMSHPTVAHDGARMWSPS